MLTISSPDDVIVASEVNAGGSDDAYGEAALCSGYGTHPADGVRALCRSVRGKPQSPELHLHGSISVHGLCTTEPVASPGSHPADGVRALCRSVRGKPQSPELHLHGSISVHGLCTTDVSRKPARHRSMPAFAGREALPPGDSWAGLAQYAGQCERYADRPSVL